MKKDKITIQDLASIVSHISKKIDDMGAIMTVSNDRMDNLTVTVQKVFSNVDNRISSVGERLDNLNDNTGNGFDVIENRLSSASDRIDLVDGRVSLLAGKMAIWKMLSKRDWKNWMTIMIS